MSHQHQQQQSIAAQAAYQQQLAIAQKAAPQEIKAAADYLVGKSDLKLKNGVLNGQRAQYFKGKHGQNAILRDHYQEYRLKENPLLPQTQTRQDTAEVFTQLLKHRFIFPVHRMGDDGNVLRAFAPQEVRGFSEDHFYIWLYQGSQIRNMLLGVGVLLVVFLGVLSPLWPQFMKTGAYYLSLGILGIIGVFFALALFRLVLYILVRVTTGRELWLFPNLFADVGFFESFVPLFG